MRQAQKSQHTQISRRTMNCIVGSSIFVVGARLLQKTLEFSSSRLRCLGKGELTSWTLQEAKHLPHKSVIHGTQIRCSFAIYSSFQSLFQSFHILTSYGQCFLHCTLTATECASMARGNDLGRTPWNLLQVASSEQNPI